MSARPPALFLPLWPRLLLLSLLLLGEAPGPRRGAAFYLPGLAPVNFCEEGKKSDECKVSEARRTPGCTVGRESLLLPGEAVQGGRGRRREWGRVTTESPRERPW